MGLWRALTQSHARTDRRSTDPALRGRTYAIPFARVWEAAVELSDGGLRGWRTTRADEEAGIIEAEATTTVLRFVDDVRVRVALDANAQTRVDVESRSRRGSGDLGANRRRIRRFLATLDRRLGAGSAQILDATREGMFIG